MAEIVSTRAPKDMAKDIEEIEKEERVGHATMVRRLLAKAIALRSDQLFCFLNKRFNIIR